MIIKFAIVPFHDSLKTIADRAAVGLGRGKVLNSTAAFSLL